MLTTTSPQSETHPMPIDHPTLVTAVRAAFEPLDYVHALFEAGSAAFGRADALSDIDLTADVDEGREDEAFTAVETALEQVAPIEIRWIIPTPAWHGMAQRFYRLAGSPPHLMVDLTLRPAGRPDLFAERELHGEPVVYFDKRGLVKSIPADPAKVRADVAARVATLRVQLPLLEHLVIKELTRGHPIDAIGYYFSLVLRPLVELLRVRHCPARHAFGLRYLDHDLPAADVARLTPLLFVRDAEDLAAKHAQAVEWCLDLLSAPDIAQPVAPDIAQPVAPDIA